MKNVTVLICVAFRAVFLWGQGTVEIDPTFAENGIYQANVCTWDILADFALQPDGKIVAAGFSEKNDLSEFLVVRLLPDGSPDLDFGIDGIALEKISNYFSNEACALALQPDGKILVGGLTSPKDNIDIDFALLRFTPEGVLDTSFRGNGKVLMNLGIDERIQDIAVLPDGKILVAGTSRLGMMSGVVARFLPDGAPDLSFGAGKGYVVSTFGTTYDVCSSLTVQPDGKILVVGSTVKTNGWPDVALARLLPDGALDTTFGSGGKVTTAFGTTAETGLKAVVQPDGRIVVAGVSNNSLKKSELALFRYLPNGALDPSFGSSGKVRSKIGDTYSSAESLWLRPDGKILVAGSAYNEGTGLDFAMKQFNPNGTVDASFGVGGAITADLDGGADGVSEILFADDGRILLAGSGFNSAIGNNDLVIMRYLSDLYVGVVDAPQSVLSPWIYPNPVSTTTVSVQYELRDAEEVLFELYATNGSLLSILSRGEREAGKQTEDLNLPSGLQNGYYLLNIRTGTGNAAIRILLAR